jgi:ketosteroid isomerase-like protein
MNEHWRLSLLCLLAMMAVLGSGCATGPDRSAGTSADPREAEISRVLRRQAEAWNRGDLGAFMADYHPDVVFLSGGTVTRGRDDTLARYRQRYATKEDMGMLAFSKLEFTLLSRNVMLVIGEWSLDRAPEPIGGNFSLVFARSLGPWKIIHDHTSRGDG